MKPVKTTTGQVRSLCKQPTATLAQLEMHITTLDPGKESHPPHRHVNEELIVLREGHCETLSNGKWIEVGPGAVVFTPPTACTVSATWAQRPPSTPSSTGAPTTTAAGSVPQQLRCQRGTSSWAQPGFGGRNPILARGFSGGRISSRMASNTALNCLSYSLSIASRPAGPDRDGERDLPELDEGAHDGDVDLTARGLLNTLESMATPCSVKA